MTPEEELNWRSGHAGGPAFPSVVKERSGGDSFTSYYFGMSLRDWFAGQVLAGLLGNSNLIHWQANLVAAEAYDIADAMLEARKRSSDVQDE